MRPITISLDATTWELAKGKKNFSKWVRDQLRSERNKKEVFTRHLVHWKCLGCKETTPWPVDEKYPFCMNSRSCPGDSEMEMME